MLFVLIRRIMQRELLRLDGWSMFTLGLREFWSGLERSLKREMRAGEVDLLNYYHGWGSRLAEAFSGV